MAYTVINQSNETIRWSVLDCDTRVWTSELLAPGERASANDPTPGVDVQISVEVPQYDPNGNPHGSMGWGGAMVHKDGCVTVLGNWDFDVRRRCAMDDKA